jgi:hypothetical protein
MRDQILSVIAFQEWKGGEDTENRKNRFKRKGEKIEIIL